MAWSHEPRATGGSGAEGDGITRQRAGIERGLPMRIDGLDHLVLTVADIPTTLSFYSRVLGMEVVTLAGGRKALVFGAKK